AAWSPLGSSPPGPARLPLTHTGLQRAPCGCLFDPRVFRIQWTTTDLPPPATATLGQGAASLPAAALWGPGGCGAPLAWAAPGTPQGQPQYLAPYENKRSGVAPAPLELPVSIPSYEDIEGPLAKTNTCGMATPAGAPPGSDVPPGPCADPHNQALGEPVGELSQAAPEKVALQEALVLLDCSLDGVGVSQDAPSRSSMPEDAGGTGAATPDRDFSSLSLPEELLTPDYCIPELSDIMLSLKISNVIGMEPQEEPKHHGAPGTRTDLGGREGHGHTRQQGLQGLRLEHHQRPLQRGQGSVQSPSKPQDHHSLPRVPPTSAPESPALPH
uniref:Proline rich 22 n=1 Tax=Aquila chrysaetos chrysaetos TaxID=223781 RepID=A0A663DN16_AQUCH